MARWPWLIFGRWVCRPQSRSLSLSLSSDSLRLLPLCATDSVTDEMESRRAKWRASAAQAGGKASIRQGSHGAAGAARAPLFSSLLFSSLVFRAAPPALHPTSFSFSFLSFLPTFPLAECDWVSGRGGGGGKSVVGRQKLQPTSEIGLSLSLRTVARAALSRLVCTGGDGVQCSHSGSEVQRRIGLERER
jgi:hypothetical protein